MMSIHFKNYLPILFFILIFIFFLHPYEGTGDFYHHVNTGRYIIENHTFPNLDTFSFTASGMPWVAHSWGSGLIFFLLLSHFGTLSITFLNALVATFTLILLYFLLRAYGPRMISCLAGVLLTAIAFSTRFPQRPEIFAYPLTILILLVDAKRKHSPRLVYFLPLIILIWANIYGSAVLFGVGLVGLLGVKQFINDSFQITKSNFKFYVLCLLSFVAAFINPYTYRTVFYFYLYIPKVSVYEGEWAGIPRLIENMPVGQLITQQYYILIYFLFVIIYVTLILFARKILKRFSFLFILSLSIVLPFFAFRTFPLVAILCAPIISVIVEFIIHKKKFSYFIFPILLTLCAFYFSTWINTPKLTNPQNQELASLTNFIQSNKLTGNVFNLGHFGGYITYKFYPEIKVYFDTRDELYINSPAIKDLYSTFTQNASVIPLLKKYNVDFVIADYLTDQMNYRDLFYSLDYVPIYLNDRYFIVVPKKFAEEKNIKSLSFVDPFSKTAAKPGQEKEALAYYSVLSKNNPNSLTDKLYLASVLSSLNKYDEAIRIAKEINIDDTSPAGPSQLRDKASLLADSYIAKGDCKNTKIYLDQAQKPIKRLLIFKHESTQDYVPHALAFYDVICEKDVSSGIKALNEYFMQNNNPLEKLETQKEFDRQASKL